MWVLNRPCRTNLTIYCQKQVEDWSRNGSAAYGADHSRDRIRGRPFQGPHTGLTIPGIILSFVIWNVAWFSVEPLCFASQRMGEQAPAPSGNSGWMAQGPSHMAVFGAHFQFSRHYVSNAWGRKTIYNGG